MNFTFLNSFEIATKSRLVFDSLSTKWKTILIYRAALASILIFGLMYYFKLGFSLNWVYYPICNLPICLFFGWALYKFSVGSRHNAILQQFEGLPANYFGSVSVSVDSNGITFHSPYIQNKYDWRLINSIKITKDYLFFTFDNHFIFSIPISALGVQQTEFLEKVKSWMSNEKQETLNSTNSVVS